eukprot:gb/GECG01008402.1/.p1 GENE.gb/GECG01008402.1/~~gb/GECG01008402.1/.p1  ORF type:complete len:291 (+),score=51.14 gb/GECG01008402.1/:1-873(+)
MVGSSASFLEPLLSQLAHGDRDDSSGEDSEAQTNSITRKWPPTSLVESLQESHAATSSAIGSHKALHHTVMSSMANAFSPLWRLYYGDNGNHDDQYDQVSLKEETLEQTAIVADLIVGLFLMTQEKQSLSTEAVAATITLLLSGIWQACTTTKDKQQVMDVVKGEFVKYTKEEAVEKMTDLRKDLLEAIHQATSNGGADAGDAIQETQEEGKHKATDKDETKAQQETGVQLLRMDEAIEAANLITDLLFRHWSAIQFTLRQHQDTESRHYLKEVSTPLQPPPLQQHVDST